MVEEKFFCGWFFPALLGFWFSARSFILCLCFNVASTSIWLGIGWMVRMSRGQNCSCRVIWQILIHIYFFVFEAFKQWREEKVIWVAVAASQWWDRMLRQTSASPLDLKTRAKRLDPRLGHLRRHWTRRRRRRGVGRGNMLQTDQWRPLSLRSQYHQQQHRWSTSRAWSAGKWSLPGVWANPALNLRTWVRWTFMDGVTWF